MMKPSSQNLTLVPRNAVSTSFNPKQNKWDTHSRRRMLKSPSSFRGELQADASRHFADASRLRTPTFPLAHPRHYDNSPKRTTNLRAFVSHSSAHCCFVMTACH